MPQERSLPGPATLIFPRTAHSGTKTSVDCFSITCHSKISTDWEMGGALHKVKGRQTEQFRARIRCRPASQSIRFVIAECSPQHLAGVGLLIADSEKRANGCQPLPRQSILCCPICQARIAKYGHFPRISGKGWRNFSAVQTYWRRAKDSNRRYNSGIYRRIKLDSQMLRFVIANHSPKGFAKTDLCSATREKARGNVFSRSSTGFLWSGFRENYRNIRAISLDSSVTR